MQKISTIKVKRALLSVYYMDYMDYIVELAQFLHFLDVELICAEGTFKLLKSKGIKSISVEKFACIKEFYGGMIKTIDFRVADKIKKDKNP